MYLPVHEMAKALTKNPQICYHLAPIFALGLRPNSQGNIYVSYFYYVRYV
jgi:hypothetical protein